MYETYILDYLYVERFYLQEKKQTREGKTVKSSNTREVEAVEGQIVGDAADMKESDREARVIRLRPLNMQDFRHAKNQVVSLDKNNTSLCSNAEVSARIMSTNLCIQQNL